jgi:glycosyltransferase EpsD
MPRKILFISNTANFAKFNRPFMRWFREQGWQVDYASAGEEDVPDCDNHYTIAIARHPFKLKNVNAYKELSHILANGYDIVHCHTPTCACLARLASRKDGARLIYTAHGFHFFKEAPLVNWLVYYPIEKHLSRFTDGLVTINKEDYDLAKKKFKVRVAVSY